MDRACRRATQVTTWGFWRRVVQAGGLLLVGGWAARHLIYGAAPGVEAYCPFGAVETLWTTVADGSFLRRVSAGSGVALLVVVLSSLALGRVFCGWSCPLGTLQDLVGRLARWLSGGERILPLRPPRLMDRALRWGKVAVLGAVLWASIGAVVPPLAPFCALRTLFEFDGGSLLGWGVLLIFFTTSLLMERFLCRYLCPFGALLSPINALSPIRPGSTRTAAWRAAVVPTSARPASPRRSMAPSTPSACAATPAWTAAAERAP